MKTEIQKPHIRFRLHATYFGSAWICAGKTKVGGHVSGYGESPTEAYKNWRQGADDQRRRAVGLPPRKLPERLLLS